MTLQPARLSWLTCQVKGLYWPTFPRGNLSKTRKKSSNWEQERGKAVKDRYCTVYISKKAMKLTLIVFSIDRERLSGFHEHSCTQLMWALTPRILSLCGRYCWALIYDISLPPLNGTTDAAGVHVPLSPKFLVLLRELKPAVKWG